MAIEDYNTAIELDPKNSSAYNNRGFAYFELGEYELAIRDFNEYIRMNKNSNGNVDPYIGLSVSYYQLNNVGEAKKYYQVAIEIEPLFKQGLEAVEKEKKYYYTPKQRLIFKQILDLSKDEKER